MKYSFDFTKENLQGASWNKNSSKNILQYAIGALLYTPAVNPTIADEICYGKYENMKSIALCLEDSIFNGCAEESENILIETVSKIYTRLHGGEISIEQVPLIFIRICNPKQMEKVFNHIRDFAEVITGFVLPKVDTPNMQQYSEVLSTINAKAEVGHMYIMPIVECEKVLDLGTRFTELSGLKESFICLQEYILNVRVGGNDFCKQYGFRRGISDTIYEIGVLNHILSDIMNVFGRDYIISAPVWEYFGDLYEKGDWLKGLNAELKSDQLNGFIGKTAIHPLQLLPIQQSHIVSVSDFEDAKKILNWDGDIFGVQKSFTCERMNEAKVHQKWAEKILNLAQVYGVADENSRK